MNSPSGREFIRLYYTVGPQVADWLQRKKCIKKISRGVIDVLVTIIKLNNVGRMSD